MATRITEALISSKIDPGGAAFVLSTEAGGISDHLSFLEEGEKLKSDSGYSQFGLKQNRQSTLRCSMWIRWTLCACLFVCIAIVSAVIVWNREDLFDNHEKFTPRPKEVVGSLILELPSSIVSPSDGADYFAESYQDSEQSEYVVSAIDSYEEMGDEPGAPSASDSEDCQSVTYGDDAVLNCSRAHVLNLTVTSNSGYDSLTHFLARFPNLKTLKLDFANFCPQPCSSEDGKSSPIVELTSLEKLTIANSKHCEHLISTFTFKMPKLVHLGLVNARLDSELNKQILDMLQEACQPKPQGTLDFVDIWHSDICRKCGFEFDECEAEPSSGYNYVKYF